MSTQRLPGSTDSVANVSSACRTLQDSRNSSAATHPPRASSEAHTGSAIAGTSPEQAELVKLLKPDLRLDIERDPLIVDVVHPLARKILQIIPVNSRIPCPAKDCSKEFKSHMAFLSHIITNHRGPLEDAANELRNLRRPIIRRLFCLVGEKNALDCVYPPNRKQPDSTARSPQSAANGGAGGPNSSSDSLASRSHIFGTAALVESNRMIVELLTEMCKTSGATLPASWHERPILRQWDEAVANLTGIRSAMGKIVGTVATPVQNESTASSEPGASTATTTSGLRYTVPVEPNDLAAQDMTLASEEQLEHGDRDARSSTSRVRRPSPDQTDGQCRKKKKGTNSQSSSKGKGKAGVVYSTHCTQRT
ncbi:hypothetical protein sr11942 [Sporisorium reilianum SRZ2]|uniref:C2H2-type domain-containing protein n=1 Tax=Sporisorium reilianum (strain SRZ2) TaxID=999809 RepID=E6ZL73_SPORE|nr:hypothetical protein sr11942 [Sporisorium reilianum SRZ2]